MEYITVKGVCESVKVIERSKFICYLKGVSGREDAEAFVAAVKKKNSLATHNCYAFIADERGLVRKFSDDGEPQGTAGAPILDVLSSAGLSLVAAVVTRYFGGVKLGTGGLCRAYSSVTAECVEKATKTVMKYCRVLAICCDYTAYRKIVPLLNGKDCRAETPDFSDVVKINVAVPESFVEGFMKKLNDFTGGKANAVFSESGYREFEV